MIEIGDLAAILTATGISIYVLGLVGLAIPRSKITKDTSTAWYATSLIPRIVVAGQGARIWLGLPLILTAFTSLTSLFMVVVYPDLYVLLYVIVLSVILVPFIIHASLSLGSVPRGSRRHILFGSYMCGVALIGAGAGGLALALIGESSLELKAFFVSWGVFTWIIIEFVGAFLIGLPEAVSADAPLLDVRIDKRAEDSTDGVGESLKGRLVAHSDGFWHFFDENNTLLSIPDDKVSRVQIPGQEDGGSLKSEPREVASRE
jgi:hypothetical protein